MTAIERARAAQIWFESVKCEHEQVILDSERRLIMEAFIAGCENEAADIWKKVSTPDRED